MPIPSRLTRRTIVGSLATVPIAGLTAVASAQDDATPTGGTPGAEPPAAATPGMATPVADVETVGGGDVAASYGPDSVPGEDGMGELRKLAILTGPEGINGTPERYNVHGTDLGSMFEHKGALYMVFGDTFGPRQSDWRSNVMAVISSDEDPADGLTFDGMIVDADQPDRARALILQTDVPGPEVTIIPTYGISTGDRMVLHYMQVTYWGPTGGRWDLGRSGLAYSDDDGETWIVDEEATWPGDSHFGQVAFVPPDAEGMVHVFGITGGRFNGVAQARVALATLMDLATWEYWDGEDWVTGDHTAAIEILPAPAGELTVQWNSHYGQWLMMYLNEERAAIVLRTSAEITGPWSDERVVVRGQDYPALYAPYLPPRWNDGPEIRFAFSMFGPYNVLWMETSIADQ